jgi:hypothetical protein
MDFGKKKFKQLLDQNGLRYIAMVRAWIGWIGSSHRRARRQAAIAQSSSSEFRPSRTALQRPVCTSFGRALADPRLCCPCPGSDPRYSKRHPVPNKDPKMHVAAFAAQVEEAMELDPVRSLAPVVGVCKLS